MRTLSLKNFMKEIIYIKTPMTKAKKKIRRRLDREWKDVCARLLETSKVKRNKPPFTLSPRQAPITHWFLLWDRFVESDDGKALMRSRNPRGVIALTAFKFGVEAVLTADVAMRTSV